MELKVLPCRACAETGMRELVVHEVETVLRPHVEWKPMAAMHAIVCKGSSGRKGTIVDVCLSATADRHASFEAAVEQWNAAQGGE